LRVLQEKKVVPIGSSKEISIDFRLICASKPNLKKLTAEGNFLPDLYYRISPLDIQILPLRERPEDLKPLVAYIKNKIELKENKAKEFTVKSIEKLQRYSWPGNIRELENVIRMLYYKVSDHVIIPENLPKEIRNQKSISIYRNDALISFSELEAEHEKQKLELILKAYQLTSYNLTKTAEILQMKRTTLSSILKKYNVLKKPKSERFGMLNCLIKVNS